MAPGASWGLLGAPGSSWKVLEAPGGSWRLLEAPGGSWGLLGAPGGSWKALEPLDAPGDSCLQIPCIVYWESIQVLLKVQAEEPLHG